MMKYLKHVYNVTTDANNVPTIQMNMLYNAFYVITKKIGT